MQPSETTTAPPNDQRADECSRAATCCAPLPQTSSGQDVIGTEDKVQATRCQVLVTGYYLIRTMYQVLSTKHKVQRTIVHTYVHIYRTYRTYVHTYCTHSGRPLLPGQQRRRWLTLERQPPPPEARPRWQSFRPKLKLMGFARTHKL